MTARTRPTPPDNECANCGWPTWNKGDGQHPEWCRGYVAYGDMAAWRRSPAPVPTKAAPAPPPAPAAPVAAPPAPPPAPAAPVPAQAPARVARGRCDFGECRARATVALVKRNGRPLGDYCDDHANLYLSNGVFGCRRAEAMA